METRCSRSLVVLVIFLTTTPFTYFFRAIGADEPTLTKKAEDRKEEVALTAVNEKGKTTAFTAAALAKLPRQSRRGREAHPHPTALTHSVASG
jgi:hypothetical protein